jgi:thioredoxin-like negative regulator of GroEL
MAAASVAPRFEEASFEGIGAEPPVEEALLADDARPDARPLLVFISSARSGPSRRMESLVAHIARKERHRLRVVQVDSVERADLVTKLAVKVVPAVVLVAERKVVARIEGRASAPSIEAMLEEHFSLLAV